MRDTSLSGLQLAASYFMASAEARGFCRAPYRIDVGNAGRATTRTIGGNLNFGYSRNEAVNVAAVGRTKLQLLVRRGELWSRPWGRKFECGALVPAAVSDRNSSFCIGSSCSSEFCTTPHFVTLDWHHTAKGIISALFMSVFEIERERVIWLRGRELTGADYRGDASPALDVDSGSGRASEDRSHTACLSTCRTGTIADTCAGGRAGRSDGIRKAGRYDGHQ